MYKLCKSEQSAARQRWLEQGLLQEMLLRRYEDISISDLCARLQIPRKSFYRYFTNKDGALFALIDHTLMEFKQYPGMTKNGAVADLEGFFYFWYERRDFLEALMRNRLSGLLVERATSHALHEKLMPAYLLPQNQTSQELAMTFAVCGLLAMVMQWHQRGYQETAQQIAQVATRLLTNPLIPLTK